MSGVNIKTGETLLGILPAYPGLSARLSTPGDAIPQYIPVVSIAVIRGPDGEGCAIHRIEGVTKPGSALACDLPGFDGYEWRKPINTSGGNIEEALIEYLLGAPKFVVGKSKRDNYGPPELPEGLLDMLKRPTQEGNTPIEFGKDIVGIAKAILLADAIVNTNNAGKYSEMYEAANDFALINRFLDNCFCRVTRSHADPEEIKDFRKKMMPALKAIDGYARGFSMYAKFQSCLGGRGFGGKRRGEK